MFKTNGTTFPTKGLGLAEMTRFEYATLPLIAKAHGDASAVKSFQYNKDYADDPDAIAKAKAIHDGTCRQ